MGSADADGEGLEGEPGVARAGRGRRVWRVVVRGWVVVAVGFFAYLFWSYRATGFDAGVMRSDGRVVVGETGERIEFRPAGVEGRGVSLVFVPGAMVEPAAYGPLARAVAERGYRVVIVKMPWRMASFEGQRRAVVERVRGVTEEGGAWVVAGHSAGGRWRRGWRGIIRGGWRGWC